MSFSKTFDREPALHDDWNKSDFFGSYFSDFDNNLTHITNGFIFVFDQSFITSIISSLAYSATRIEKILLIGIKKIWLLENG